MDELEISGRRYISSARAAKEHKYHADYIGQLVRGGKVAGQKVGRAWYVDEVSLAEYLGKESAQAPKSVAKPIKKAVPAPVVKIVEEEVSEVEEEVEEEPEVTVGTKENLTEEKQDVFLQMQKFARRPHVIAPLTGEVRKPAKKEIIVEAPVVEVEEEHEGANADVYAYEAPTEDITAPTLEEEVFIPVKVERAREPEDSFYKIPRKGLKYIASRPVARTVAPEVVPAEEPAQTYEDTYADIAPQQVRARSRYSLRVGVLASLIFVAGIVSLGGGVVLSYYLHSATVVNQEGQVSSLILSQ